jgi:phage-related protein
VNEEPWTIEFYKDARGRSPVEDFLQELQPDMQHQVGRIFDLVQLFGDRLGMPHSRPLAGYRFNELRIRSRASIVRIFYFAAIGRRIVMLHGYVKKDQRIPRRELEIASRRRAEYGRS